MPLNRSTKKTRRRSSLIAWIVTSLLVDVNRRVAKCSDE
jgi:hypothetical protein